MCAELNATHAELVREHQELMRERQESRREDPESTRERAETVAARAGFCQSLNMEAMKRRFWTGGSTLLFVPAYV